MVQLSTITIGVPGGRQDRLHDIEVLLADTLATSRFRKSFVVVIAAINDTAVTCLSMLAGHGFFLQGTLYCEIRHS